MEPQHSPDLFALLESLDPLPESHAQPLHSFVLVAGSSRSGKSSLLFHFSDALLPANALPSVRPTLGLEYSFLRPPVAAPRALAHVWEAGGAAASSAATAAWFAIPLTPQRLSTSALVLVLDCARPTEVCVTAARVLAAVRRRVDECMEKLARAARAGGAAGAAPAPPPAQPDVLWAAAAARLRLGWAQRSGKEATGTDGGLGASASPFDAGTVDGIFRVNAALPPHPDAARLFNDFSGSNASSGASSSSSSSSSSSALLPIPAVIIASKWDAIAAAPAPARRALLCALRFIALSHGAALVGTSSSQRPTLIAARALFNSAVFGTAPRRGMSGGADGDVPPLFPVGADSLADIATAAATLPGSPSAAALEAAASAQGVPWDARAEPFAAFVRAAFASVTSDDGGVDENEDLVAAFPEPSVDAVVAERAAAAAATVLENKERERRVAAEARAAHAVKTEQRDAGSERGSRASSATAK